MAPLAKDALEGEPLNRPPKLTLAQGGIINSNRLT
jgi:hypothetical protein